MNWYKITLSQDQIDAGVLGNLRDLITGTIYGPSAPEFSIAMNMALYVATTSPPDGSLAIYLSPELASQLSTILAPYGAKSCSTPESRTVVAIVGMLPFANDLLGKS